MYNLLAGGGGQLNNQAGRKQWEQQFAARYIQPLLQQVDQLLQAANTAMTNDNRLGE